MDNLLLPNKRKAPLFYDVEFRGKKERTVSIRGGLTFPQAERPGYFCLVAQIEQRQKVWESSPEDKTLRFLAFAEGREPLMKDFFEKIAEACRTWRIDRLCHGNEPGDESFSNHLYDYLKSKREGSDIVQRPSVYKSWRCQQLDFLVSMVRDYLAKKTLLLFNLADNHAPLLTAAIRNTPREADILEVREIKALAYVMDDFDCSPWTAPPKPEKNDQNLTPWAF